jgi:organic radical activating enzyme
MKPFPIKVEKDSPPEYFDISWKLHNVCTYNCSFCDPSYKDGTDRWLSLEDNKLIVDRLVTAAKGKPVWIMFTGGEPTLFPEFVELVKYIKETGAFVGLLSNGTRSLRWWKELQEAHVLDNLLLTLHPEQGADHTHFAEILNLFLDEHTMTTCWITSTKDTIKQSIDSHLYLSMNTGADLILKAMDIRAYDLDSYLNSHQKTYIQNRRVVRGRLASQKTPSNIPKELSVASNMVNVTMSDGTVKTASTQTVIRENLNIYTGWDCNVGEFQAYVDRNKMHRGACFHATDQYIDLLKNEAAFISDALTCKMDACLCGSDIISTKTIHA